MFCFVHTMRNKRHITTYLACPIFVTILLYSYIFGPKHTIAKQSTLEMTPSTNFGDLLFQHQIPTSTRWEPHDFSWAFMNDFDWVEHTTSWWNSTRGTAISPLSLQGLKESENPRYVELAAQFRLHNYVAAARLLSTNPDAITPRPAVAVFMNAFVSENGDVKNASFSLQGKSCNAAPSLISRILSTADILPQYDSVATISHYWGYGYFHFVAENLIRVPLILNSLQRNQNMKLHVNARWPFVLSLLKILDVDSSRVIQGRITAKKVLVPEPIACGDPPANLLQLLQHYILKKIPHQIVAGPSLEDRGLCNILIVKRQGHRSITNHNEMVLRIASAQGCDVNEVIVHTGKETALDQLSMFRSARIVVAPHGAGLVNIIVCREGTTVLELMVQKVNICYMSMAFKLGLYYIMMSVLKATQHAEMTVDIPNVVSAIKDVQPQVYYYNDT